MKDLAILPGLTPTFTHQFDGLAKGKHVTNCSLFPWRGKMLLAYRVGWFGSRIHVAEIGKQWEVLSDRVLTLDHPLAVGGQEDPRLFEYDGALHVAFSGSRLTRHEATIARQLFARLDDGMNAVRVWEPSYLWTTQWEKNWQPFDWGGHLLAVYSMDPWRIVSLVGDKAEPIRWGDRMELDGLRWPFGEPRGGAPPVRCGDEYYCFFHGTDKTEYDDGEPAIYSVGVMTFDAETLAPKRATREPILWPDMSDLPRGEHGKGTWYAATAYPCGAFLRGDEWIVSYGHNDHWCRASGFKTSDVEGRLCPI